MSDNLFANIAPAPEKKAAPAEKAKATDKVVPEQEAPKSPVIAPADAVEDDDDTDVAVAPDETDDEPPVAPAENTDKEEALTAFNLMKDRAKLMGITFSNNIGPEALAAKIKAKIDGEEEPKQKDASLAQTQEQHAVPEEKPVKVKSLRQHLYDENMRLIRIRLTNLDPKDSGLPGEIFTVANEYLGTVTKLIPYGEAQSEAGYHIPYCILKQLRARKFLKIDVTKNSKGQEEIKHKYVRKYAIEILPPLTEVELQRLATAQLATGSLED